MLTYIHKCTYRQDRFPIPHDVIVHVFQYLDRNSIESCNNVCKIFKAAADCIYPGLKLKLYPHQVNSGKTNHSVYLYM